MTPDQEPPLTRSEKVLRTLATVVFSPWIVGGQIDRSIQNFIHDLVEPPPPTSTRRSTSSRDFPETFKDFWEQL